MQLVGQINLFDFYLRIFIIPIWRPKLKFRMQNRGKFSRDKKEENVENEKQFI